MFVGSPSLPSSGYPHSLAAGGGLGTRRDIRLRREASQYVGSMADLLPKEYSVCLPWALIQAVCIGTGHTSDVGLDARNQAAQGDTAWPSGRSIASRRRPPQDVTYPGLVSARELSRTVPQAAP